VAEPTKTKKKFHLKTALCLLIVAASVWCFFIVPAIYPLHRSQDSIRSAMLQKTPPGTSRASVQAMIRANGWGGVVIPGIEPAEAIGADAGKYSGLLCEVHVVIFWHFDAQDRLIDIHVHKVLFGP